METAACKLTIHRYPLGWDNQHTFSRSALPMAHLLTLVALFFLSISQTVMGSSACLAFDASWNLYLLGVDGKDYNAATQDKWTGSKSNVFPFSFLVDQLYVPQTTRPPTSRRPVDRKLSACINIHLIRLKCVALQTI